MTPASVLINSGITDMRKYFATCAFMKYQTLLKNTEKYQEGHGTQ